MEIKSRFDHFNINVTDLERSIAFYEKTSPERSRRRLLYPGISHR